MNRLDKSQHTQFVFFPMTFRYHDLLETDPQRFRDFVALAN